MAEISGFWTTDDATPEGDQVASYDQAYWTHALEVLGACNGREGVAPNCYDELEGTLGTGANTVAINTGGGLVDGKWFKNGASQNVNIPSSSSGTTRIDRIVLRANWAGFNVSVYRIAGVESEGTPSVPAITQNSGTTYDITLYQALVNSAGAVTLTDERTWAAAHTDETTLTTSTGHLKIKDDGVDSAQIAAGAIDHEHLGLQIVAGENIALATIDHDNLGNNIVQLQNMASNSVDSDQYVDGSIDLIHMSDHSVGMDEIVHGAIGPDQLALSAVGHTYLDADCVWSNNIKDDVIDSEHYVHGSIDTEHIADSQITNALMADDAIDSAEIVDGAVDQVHLSVGASKVTNRQGGDPNSWHVAGSSDYALASARIQCGTVESDTEAGRTVTYPVAFSNTPLVWLFILGSGDYSGYYITTDSSSASVLVFSVFNSSDARVAEYVNWLAIGPA